MTDLPKLANVEISELMLGEPPAYVPPTYGVPGETWEYVGLSASEQHEWMYGSLE